MSPLSFLLPDSGSRDLRSVGPALGLLALALTLTGCAWATQTSSSSQPGISGNEIKVTELTFPVGGMSVYELISQYKSNWLQKRGQKSIKSPSPIKVYLDNTSAPYGSVSALRNIPAENVDTIKYFPGQEAQSRFGIGNVSGAILVTTRSGSS